MGFDPKNFMPPPINPLRNIVNSPNRNDVVPVVKNTMDAMLKQLEESNKQNAELKEQIKELNKPHTLGDILLILLSAAAGVGLTILAVVLGWLK